MGSSLQDELKEKFRDLDADSFMLTTQNLGLLLIILDQEIKLQYGNNVFFDLVGWEPEQVIGKDYVENFIPPEIRFVVKTTLSDIINKRVNNYSGSNLVQTKNKGLRYINWHSIHLQPSPTSGYAMLCIGIDLTENTRYSQFLSRSAAERELILDNIKEVILFADVNGCILEVNKSLQENFNVNSETAVGNYCYKTIYNLNRPCTNCPLSKLIASGNPQAVINTLPDGSRLRERLFLIEANRIHPQKILIMLEHDEIAADVWGGGSDKEEKLVKKIQGYNEIGIFSPAMQQVMEQADILRSDRSFPVLIEGETGTGKELVARYIHYGFEGSAAPFIDINCAAITPTIFESELFGYEGGAFTGGRSGGQRGKLDLAQGGTLFLDEIGEIPISIQAKLLRVIQEKEYFRVGGLKKLEADVRIVCATNVDLQKRIAEGSFRQDLFYRLEAMRIYIPPLRERREDILPLAQMFLMDISKRKGKRFRKISDKAAEILLNYPWPGNVRQLKNTIERVVLMGDDVELRSEHLAFLKNRPAENREDEDLMISLPDKEADLKKITDRIILAALRKNGGNKTATARYLNISRRALTYRLSRMVDEDGVLRPTPMRDRED